MGGGPSVHSSIIWTLWCLWVLGRRVCIFQKKSVFNNKIAMFFSSHFCRYNNKKNNRKNRAKMLEKEILRLHFLVVFRLFFNVMRASRHEFVPGVLDNPWRKGRGWWWWWWGWFLFWHTTLSFSVQMRGMKWHALAKKHWNPHALTYITRLSYTTNLHTLVQ